VTQNGSLTTKQTALIAALISGERVEQAAKTASISPRTAYRWQKEPSFQDALKEAQGQAFEKKLAVLKDGIGAALAALARNMGERSPAGVQVRAAQVWLETAIELYKMEAIEERLAELEHLLKGEYGYTAL